MVDGLDGESSDLVTINFLLDKRFCWLTVEADGLFGSRMVFQCVRKWFASKGNCDRVAFMAVVSGADFERCQSAKHSSTSCICLSKSDDSEANMSGVN